MKILLLSAYHAYSHRLWCDQLIKTFPNYSWMLLALAPRFFNWRIRGNGLIWRSSDNETLSQNFDLIIATSMTDLNSLFGFYPHLSSNPSILYFHENQFAYPTTDNARDNVEPKLVQFYSALTSTKVVFNSEYNRQSFLNGVKKLITKLPDDLPISLIGEINEKSRVLPVPIDDKNFIRSKEKANKFSICWNHRWEYDKWPECFFQALMQLSEKDIPFDLYVFGQQFRQTPPVFTKMEIQLAKHIRHWGWVEDEENYQAQLAKCHVSVSTALHDFQGLAMLDASAAGVVAVVPDRLAYSEWFDKRSCYVSNTDNLQQQVTILANVLEKLYFDYKGGQLKKSTDVAWLSWESMKDSYQQLIENT